PRVPSRSAEILWHSTHETQASACESMCVYASLMGKCGDTCGRSHRPTRSTYSIGMWQRAQSAWMYEATLGWSIISPPTAACQYGSRAEFAMIDARQSLPIETSAPAGETTELWHERQLSAVSMRKAVSATTATPNASAPVPGPARAPAPAPCSWPAATPAVTIDRRAHV